jgi:hypothetical protein
MGEKPFILYVSDVRPKKWNFKYQNSDRMRKLILGKERKGLFD